MIKFIHTSKKFGSHIVHKDINLTIPEGKVTYIIGQSGSGKSVFIKQIIGLIKPDTGSILVEGSNIMDMDDEELLNMRQRFGLVFQNAALFDSMNVFDNVAFPLREHTKLVDEEIKAIVKERLHRVGLVDIEQKYPSELSGGMKKRVGLARALVRNPEIMLYDEPTTGLDPIMTDVIDDLIMSTHKMKSAMTTVIISHDINSTLNNADNIAMIYDGTIKQGSPEFFRTTDDPVIRQFFSGSKDGPIKVL